jgi:hypothetical protein
MVQCPGGRGGAGGVAAVWGGGSRVIGQVGRGMAEAEARGHGKGQGRARDRVVPLLLSRAECHEIWESKPPGTLWATLGITYLTPVRSVFP